jgi:Ca-activated chloride channel family protein
VAAIRKCLSARKILPCPSMTGLLKAVDAGILLIVLYMLVAFLCVLLRFFNPAAARAAEQPNPDLAKRQGLSAIREGQLLLAIDKAGFYAPAPLLATRAELQVSGIVANVRVFQDFTNPTDKWLEGIYVFPLPDDAAVYHLRMHIGERIIDGIVKEREEARKVYEKKKEEGYHASLLDQERTNIFRISVANIGPREQLSVEIIYQQKVFYDNGAYSLRFPTVVGPRYIPDAAITSEYSPAGPEPFAAREDDWNRIISPVIEPGAMPVNRVSMNIHLQAGFPLAEIKSLYHGVDVTENDDGSRDIVLAGSGMVADRDFVLEWKPEPESGPRAALFTEKIDGEIYGLLMVMPPTPDMHSRESWPRTLLFVLDISGSMAGASERQARCALQTAISRLTSQDHFNIITFNDSPGLLFQEPVPVTHTTIQKAKHFLKNIESEGGTEIYPALAAALSNKEPGPHELLQIILITDGCVGNDETLLRAIKSQLGGRRLFSVGIGSAPNGYFMKAAARLGRGSFTFIGDPSEAQARMVELFRKIENPMLTDIELVLPEQELLGAFPDPLPDLYLGEPVSAVFRINELPDMLLLHGRLAGKKWQMELMANDAEGGKGLAVLWAREKIRGLMDSLTVGVDKTEVRTEVVRTALAHNLVSRYTSMLAVETTPVRPIRKNLQKTLVTTNLPQGWIYSKVFRLPQTASVAGLCFVVGFFFLVLAVLVSLFMIYDRRVRK